MNKQTNKKHCCSNRQRYLCCDFESETTIQEKFVHETHVKRALGIKSVQFSAPASSCNYCVELNTKGCSQTKTSLRQLTRMYSKFPGFHFISSPFFYHLQVSIIARQHDATLSHYHTRSGDTIELLYPGDMSAEVRIKTVW